MVQLLTSYASEKVQYQNQRRDNHPVGQGMSDSSWCRSRCRQREASGAARPTDRRNRRRGRSRIADNQGARVRSSLEQTSS